MTQSSNNYSENFKITGDWALQAKSLKSRFSLLTDSDLHLEPGKDHEVLSKIQQRLNKSREETISIIRNAGQENPRPADQGGNLK